MRIEVLKEDKLEAFIEYCKKHRGEVDDSFLYDEDLKSFQPNEENPTYVIINQNEEITAAAALIIDDYHKRGRKGRFRIFHSEVEDIECYCMLMDEINKHTEGLDNVFLFVPLQNESLIELIRKINFNIERYSFLLIRNESMVPRFDVPKDFQIRQFRSGKDEEIWCKVRNAGFANLQGSETPMTPEMVTKMISASDYIKGGMLILYHGEKPIGVVRGAEDEYENSPIMNIGPLALIPEYQSKGLGRILLRTILNFAKEKSYDRTVLCVNGDNERAKALYVQEGFKQVEGVVCYKYDLA